MNSSAATLLHRLGSKTRFVFPLVLVAAGCTLVLVLLSVSANHFKSSAESIDRVQLYQDRLIRLEHLLRIVVDAETATRGYLITKSEAYLEPLQSSEIEIDALLSTLDTDYPPGDPDREEFVKLTRLIEAERTLLRKTVDAGRLVTPVPRNGEGLDKTIMDRIRALVNRLEERSREINLQLIADAKQRLNEIRQVVTELAIGAIVLMLGLFAFQQRQSSLRARIALMLQEENTTLESLVAQRTDDLSQLASHLTTMQEQERGRLARELHDELGALLTAAKMDADALQRLLAGNTDDAIKTRFRRLIDMIGAGIRIKRRIIDDLRPPLLQGLGLIEALRALGDTVAGDVKVSLQLPASEPALSEDQSLALFRIAQESLTNMRKYANASNVELGFAASKDDVLLWVEDNGRGFDTSTSLLHRHGIAGMRHRAQMFSGRLAVRSAPGQGTRVEVRLPLRAASAAAT